MNEKIKKIDFGKLYEKYKINLFNYYDLDQQQFQKIYKQCKALLYLSSNETIGLPILEAYRNNLFIIAPKLPYSDQFIKPDFMFDFDKKDDLLQCIEKSLKSNFKIKNDRKI